MWLDATQRLNQQSRALVDRALDRVFDEPYTVVSAEDFERLMTEHHGRGGPGLLASAGAIAAFVRSATPVAERLLKYARVGTSTAGKAYMPAKVAKYTLAIVPVAMSLTGSTRRGIHELQVLASYLISTFRAAGIEPDRALVRALTVSIARSPDRRPQLDGSAARASAGVGTQWVMRSVGKDTPAAVRTRARAQLAAVERLDVAEVARQWGGATPGLALGPGQD
ncbi:MAG: hypothetical protein ACHQIG_08695 [Acidimicrobiia bacterium]